MKKTALFEIHNKLGAKIAPFGGFEMPIQYSGVTKEHLAVRESVGVFDVSHMGEFIVEGENANQFLQYVCSNAIDKLNPGKAQYNCFPNGNGGVIDDLIVYQLEVQKYLLVVNAANIEKDWNWLQQNNTNFNTQITDQSEYTGLLAIQGPNALEAMQKISSVNLSTLPYYAHQTGTFAGIPNVLIATTGYTGSGGIEIYFDRKHAIHIWDAVFEAGNAYGIIPVGLAARDTLRLEKGFCLYGNEIDDTTSPIAAGLGWITKPQSGCIDAERLAQEKKEGTPQKLVGLVLQERGIPRAGYPITDREGNTIGRITSGTQSPVLKKGIGLGYVNQKFAKVETLVQIKIRDKFYEAQVVPLPFI